ncbi:hypothetical protein HDU76_006253 [Blyttiomyces sp. JEL0837]|nr:hypothetical protein HDU76_006253 [Blyttiomyces sp. JEL0837]
MSSRGTLNDSEQSIISSALRGSEVLAAAVARLYLASESTAEWKYQEKVGAVVLAKDRGSFSFQFVDLRVCVSDWMVSAILEAQKDRRVVWTAEHSSDFKYYTDRPFFHCFPSPSDRCMAAFSFADEDEASEFAEKVNRKKFISPSTTAPPAPTIIAPPVPPQPPRASVIADALPIPKSNLTSARSSLVSETSSTISKSPSADISELDKKKSKKEKSESSGGFFSKKKKDKKGGKIDKSMISAPTEFKHVSHVGYDPKTGFSAQNIPMEWKVIFQKAGITEEQLQDKKTAKFVKKFMEQHSAAGGMPKKETQSFAPSRASSAPNPPAPASAGAAATGSVRRPPPPPPPSRRPAPPPPSRPSQAGTGPAPPTMAVLTPTYAAAPSPPARPDPPARQEPTYQYNARPDPPSRPPEPPSRPDPPSRQVPALPAYNSRAVPAPPLPPPRNEPQDSYSSSFSSGGPPPPPPPPPPTGMGIPPPPPMPGMGAPPPPAPPRTQAPAPAGIPGAGGKDDLLAAIRGAGGISALKPTHREAPPSPPDAPAGGETDMAEMLKAALMKRANALGDSDSESDGDEDDEEWAD